MNEDGCAKSRFTSPVPTNSLPVKPPEEELRMHVYKAEINAGSRRVPGREGGVQAKSAAYESVDLIVVSPMKRATVSGVFVGMP